jgi:PAS domain S-box-containing protein
MKDEYKTKKQLINELAELKAQEAEHRQTEEVLRESEKKFRKLADSVDIGIVIIQEQMIRYINHAAEVLTGYSKEDLMAMPFWEIFHPDFKEIIKEQVLAYRSGNIFPYHYDLKIVTKNGKERWWHTREDVFDFGSKPALIITAYDITERKITEEMLHASETKFRTLSETTSAAIFIYQGEHYQYANPAMKSITGYTQEELLAMKFWDVIHPDFQERVKELGLKRQRGEAVPSRNEIMIVTKNGEKRWVEINAAYFEFQGRPSGLGSAFDITERKQAEEMLRVSAQEWRTTFDTISDAVCLLELDGKILRCNVAMTKLFDKPYEKIIGHTCWEIIYGTSNPIKVCSFARMRKTKRREAIVLPMRNRWFNITADPLLDMAGNLIGGIKIIRDITKQKLAEEELESSREQLRNLSAHLQYTSEEERKHIAREIHDELGQSLTALKMDISWLINKLPKDEKPLLVKTESMLGLIDKTVKTVQRISTELRPGLLDDLGLAAAIEWQAEEFQKRTGIKCKATLDEEIIVDQDRSTAIFRIFQETLTNVARHANATRVRVNLGEKAGKLMLKVKDNGKGITEKQISDPKSFGLIGIQERIHLFGGNFKISGIRDKGTTVTVGIPLGRETR